METVGVVDRADEGPEGLEPAMLSCGDTSRHGYDRNF